MTKFKAKAITFYLMALVASLMFTGLTIAAVYWLLNVAGLWDFGDLLAFKLGLALVLTGTCVYGVSQVSEDVLYGDYEPTNDPFEETEAGES